MDADIRASLKELGKHLHDVARQVESTKIDIDGLIDMREILLMASTTLDTYINIQKSINTD
jgi:hypothetical protein